MINDKQIYRVRASVYPTPHNKIWLSSGRFSPYNYSKDKKYLNLSILERKKVGYKLYFILFLIILFVLFLAIVNAQECFPDYECGEWGACIDGLQTRTCIDKRCNQRNLLERRFCDTIACTPKIECREWSECTYTQKVNDFLRGEIKFGGYRNRLCIDKNKCVESFSEEGTCEESFPLELTKRIECGQEFLIATDTVQKRQVAKINLDSWKSKRLDLLFTIGSGRTLHCPSCYNVFKDDDETRVDCGGPCKPCKEEKYFPIIPITIISWFLAAIFTFLSIKEAIPLISQTKSKRQEKKLEKLTKSLRPRSNKVTF
ncbi:hypothetical protein HYV50_04365 [Candidatus Pacearchaeota archaeon]|nr:hypothetical protein [Candidatus Pacearchaeota archaeon]